MQIQTYLDKLAVLVGDHEPLHLALRLTADRTGVARPVPAAFCIVLDRSGSMAGEPLDRAKQATTLALRNLRPEDRFALVLFDSAAQTMVPLQLPKNRGLLLGEIGRIRPGGSTNLTGGWLLGRDALREAPPGHQRRLLLLSDGHLNAGITDPAQVRQLVVTGLEQDGIRTSALGFGGDYNEDLMAELARATNGEFYDAASPEKFPAIFAAELDGLQQLAVQNVRVRIRQLTFAQVIWPLGEYPEVKRPDGWMELAVGDLVSEEVRVVCFRVEPLRLPLVNGVPAFRDDGEEVAEVEVLYDEVTATGLASRRFMQKVRICPTQDPGEVRMDFEVVQWVAVQRAGQVTAEVGRLMDAGQRDAALDLLFKTLDEPCNKGVGPGVEDAFRVLNDLAQRIQNDDWDAKERKASKYRSSSYRKMSSKPGWFAEEPPPHFKEPPTPPQA